MIEEAETLSESDTIAFPKLDAGDLAALKELAILSSFEDGEIVFRAGDADLDLFVVESGAIEILNPSDDNRHVVTHGPGQFAGDIDLLTRRPVIVTGIARGPTRLMRIPGPRLREMLNKVPRVSEKLLIAVQERRRLRRLGRRLHHRARPARAWRPGLGIVQDREFHRLSQRAFRH